MANNSNQNSRPRFQSSGHPGYTAEIAQDPRCVTARKLVHEIQVRFTPEACTVKTNEGLVRAQPGDAIVTGLAGEHWRVSRHHFPERYQPVPPTPAFEDGTYVSIARRILALQMLRDFEVLLADGISLLKGKPGDWLVDYGDGSLGIVSQSIFDNTYEVIH
jgi:hypothetical protein